MPVRSGQDAAFARVTLFTLSRQLVIRKSKYHRGRGSAEKPLALLDSAFARAHELAPRIGFGVLSLWGIYFAYQACKRIWQGRLAPDATLNTTLQSYRSELEKRLDYAQHIWRRALMFCFLGIALVIVPALIKSLDAPRLLVNFVPFFVLLAIWCAIFFPMRKRNQRKLQQEIEELRVFERENRS